MRKLLLLIFTIMAIFFSGCTREEELVSENLVLDEEVVITKGKKIIPLSSDAKVKINKNSAQSTITVTLIKGSAKVE